MSAPGGCLLWGCLFWGVSAHGGICLGGVCSQQVVSAVGGSAPRGCLLWGVSAPRGGVCLWGVVCSWGVSALGDVCSTGGVSQHALRQTPPCEFLTHAYENITLPQTSFAGGKNVRETTQKDDQSVIPVE